MKISGLFAVIAVLSLASCNTETKTDKEIEALNQAIADSLLNDALSDTLKTDSILKENF